MPPYDPEKGSRYGETVWYRSNGARIAAAKGAVAALVRSVTAKSLRTPHTGAMNYGDAKVKIPAAAVTIEDAELLARFCARGKKPVVRLAMEAKYEGEADSHNVVGEIVGNGGRAVAVQADVNLIASGLPHQGVVARYQGSGDSDMYAGIIFNFGGGPTLGIFRNLNGNWSQLTPLVAAPASFGVLAFFGSLIFFAVGVVLVFGRQGHILDRREWQITTWWGLLRPWITRSRPLGEFDRVTLERRVVHHGYDARPVRFCPFRKAGHYLLRDLVRVRIGR